MRQICEAFRAGVEDARIALSGAGARLTGLAVAAAPSFERLESRNMLAIAFEPIGSITGLAAPTSLQFGPDDRLYVSQQSGEIIAYTVELQNDEYVATGSEELTLPGGGGVVQSIQNHNDDGSLAGQGSRQVTGLLVTGTASNPVLYVTSSDPRISKNGEVGLDTNSSVLTRVTWTGTEWETVDLIRGLPRSEENHSANGLAMSPDGNTLYVQVGGNTNNGAPSTFFSNTAEYALSAALLAVDLVDLNSRQVLTDPAGGQGGVARDYVYDLPTLDDPSVPNDGVREDANGMDVAGPWGGNDGFNQAILPADAPLSIYADGLRNAYDVVVTQSGLIYTVDNGSNPNLGSVPVTDINGDPTNQINNGGDGDGEGVYRIDPLGYYGHPVPVRANPTVGWTVYDDAGNPDASVSPNSVADVSTLVPAPVNIQPGYLVDPSKFTSDANRLAQSGVRVPTSDAMSNALAVLGSSSNGVVEYTGTAFDGALQGAILVTQFNDNVTLLNVNSTGTALEPVIDPGDDGQLGTGDDVVADGDGVFPLQGLGALANPLDVTMGPDGTIWVAEIGGGKVGVYAPTDTPPPPDEDFDDDGILNVDDPFIRDDTNGTSVVIQPGETTTWSFAASGEGATTPGPEGYGGGLTGVMINGVTDYEAFFQSPSTLPNQDVQLDNVKFTTAAGGGATVVEVVSNGDPFQTSNDGEFLFHTGATIDPSVQAFTVKWSVFNPGDAFSGNFQQIGGYLGTGDQSDYLKLVAIQSGAGEIQMVLEDGDATTVSFIQADDLFNVTEAEAKKIFFEMEIDVVNETATPTVHYETSAGGLTTVTGSSMSLTGTGVLDAILGNTSVQGQTTGLAMGLFSTNSGQSIANSFQAVFDDIEVVADGLQSTPVYRVNAGGPEVADIPSWSVDTDASPSPYNNYDPNSTTSMANIVSDPVDASGVPGVPGEIFQSERFDKPNQPNLEWDFPVTPGDYEVRLYFAETFSGGFSVGFREFDVEIEGVKVLDNYDVFAEAGALTGIVESFFVTSDANLDIDFLRNLGKNNPNVKAIEILQLGVAAPSTLSIAAPTPSTVVESGDSGVTSLAFPVTFTGTPGAPVTVEYSVNVNGSITSGLTQALGTSDGTILVDVANDDVENGPETVTVTLTSITMGAAEAVLGATVAVATVTEDDEPPPIDLFNAAAAPNNDFSDDNLSPTHAVLSLGANTIEATHDATDVDYVTFEVEADQQLTAINLVDYTGGAATAFLALQTGAAAPDPSILGGGPDLSAVLDGATFYDDAQIGTDLLDELASTTIEGDGRTVAGLTTPLGPGLYTLWFEQSGAETTSMIELVTASTLTGVPGAYLPNANGNFVFEAESAVDPGAGGFDFLTTADLSPGHEAPSAGGYVEATSDHLGTPNGETLTYKFVPDQTGFVRVNLVASHQGTTSDNNDSWVEIQQNGTTVAAIDQEVPLDPVSGAYKTFSIGGSGNDFILAQRNVDGNGQPIVMPVTAGLTYDFLLTERSAGHEVDKIVLEFFTTAPTTFGLLSTVQSEPTSPQIPGTPVGAAEFTIDLDEDDVQESNFGPNSFEITNTGDKNIEKVVIDISGAILTDAVFDPFGEAGDTLAKVLTIDTAGGTGVVAPDHGTSGAPGTAYVGAGGIAGFEGLQLFFDAGDSSGFNPGETVGFSIDTDPNSIAGGIKGGLESGAIPAWDVGGVSGAELIGSTYTITFTDGSTATGQLQGVGNQGGSLGVAAQDSPDLAATLTVDGLGAGGVGEYSIGGPAVVIDGPAGHVARVVLVKGIIQPVNNTFGEPFGSQLDAQLAALAASDYPANNAAEVQTVDVLLTGAPLDITAMFDFTQVPGFDLAVPEDQVPLAFTAGVIDPVSGDPLGDVTDAIYLRSAESDLELTMLVSNSTPTQGTQIDFTLTVDNLGPNTATGVQVTDLLPDGYTFVSASGDGSYDELTGLWDVGSVTAAGSASTVITVTVNLPNPGPLDYTNYAQITASDTVDPDSTPGDASTTDDDDATVVVTPTPAEADLELTQLVSNATPVVGTTIDFTLTVDNLGPNDATGVQVTDQLPDGFAFVSAAGDGGYDGLSGVWEVGTVAASGSASIVITATVNGPDPGLFNYTNYAEITASDAIDLDSTPANASTTEDDDATVVVTPIPPLQVTAFLPNDTGFEVAFNKPLDTSVLNLYSGVGGPASDLTVLKDGAPVDGSVLYDAATDTLRFVKTGGPLEAGAYAVTLTSGADAFVSSTGENLFGGEPNGDYTDSFTVSSPSGSVLSIGDFARGPGQDVDLTPGDANDAHVPVVLDSVAGLQFVEIDVLFDPALLQITSIDPLTPGLNVTPTIDNVGGVATIFAFSAAPITGTDVALFDIVASVPVGAEYGATGLIEFTESPASGGILNEGVIPVVTDVGFHKAVFVGDADKSQSYNPNDAGLIPTVTAGSATGFAAYPLTDPAVVADSTGNGALSVFDSVSLGSELIGLDPAALPDLPPGSGSSVEATVDPTLGVPAITYAKPGDSLSLPVTLDIEPGADVYAAGFVATTDPAVVSFDGVSDGADWSPTDWTRLGNEPVAGETRVVSYNTLGQPSADGLNEIATLDYTVAASATPGQSTSLAVDPMDPTDGGLAWTAGAGDVVVTFSADNDRNGTVDILDYDVWVDGFGSTTQLDGDANGDGVVNILDYIVWRDQEGSTVAPPSAASSAPDPPASPDPLSSEPEPTAVAASPALLEAPAAEPAPLAFVIVPSNPATDPAEQVVSDDEAVAPAADSALLLLLDSAPAVDEESPLESLAGVVEEESAELPELESAFAAL